MKNNILAAALLLTLITVILPTPALALSCIYPDQEYAEMRLSENEEGIIFVGEVVEAKKIKNYDAVKVDISAVIKGYSVPEEAWVNYQIDETWGYLCAGDPPAVGAEAIFDVRVVDGIYYVGQSYPVEGEAQPARDVFLNNIDEDFEFMSRETFMADLRSYAEEVLTKFLLLLNSLTN